jgi:hypothetical protein
VRVPIWLRDPGWKKSDQGFGINIPDPQHWSSTTLFWAVYCSRLTCWAIVLTPIERYTVHWLRKNYISSLAVLNNLQGSIHVFFLQKKALLLTLLFISSIYLEPNLPEDSLLLKYPDDSNTEVSLTFNFRDIVKISSNRTGCNSPCNLYSTVISDFTPRINYEPC